jgi:hypothetical protein
VTEDDLLAGLVDAAASGGWLVFHIRRSDLGIIQGHIGFPDLVAVHAKRRAVVFIEAKAARGRVDESQRRWLDALAAAGMDVRIVKPDGYDETWRWLVGDRLMARRTA